MTLHRQMIRAAMGLCFGAGTPNPNNYWYVNEQYLATVSRKEVWSDQGTGWSHNGNLSMPVFDPNAAPPGDRRMLILPQSFLSNEDSGNEPTWALIAGQAFLDLDGYPIGFHLTGGEASDSRNFEVLLDLGPDVDLRAVVADKGYDAKTNREAARQRGICPVIPYRSNTIDKPKFFAKVLYKSAGANRANDGQDQALQTYRAARRRQQTMPHSSHSSAASS